MRKFSLTVFIILFGVFLSSTLMDAAEYYMFRFVCTDRGGTTFSEWMDERVSQSITIKDRVLLSCDSVSLVLRPLDEYFNYSSTQSKENMHLWREWAPIDGNPNLPLTWRTASNYGQPDEVQYIANRYRWERGFQWNRKWGDNYWFVLYQPPGVIFRVKVSYLDQDNHLHWFYAVPWSSR